jgi:ribosome-associated protein
MVEKAGADAFLRAVMTTLEDSKAVDVVALDLRNLSDATDYFMIASGTSDTHVRAVANKVLGALSDVDVRPHHVEGISAGRWVLLDFVDVVIHVFHPTLRDFYQLERLWSDAPRIDLDGKA